jgi:hypothetical protein
LKLFWWDNPKISSVGRNHEMQPQQASIVTRQRNATVAQPASNGPGVQSAMNP